MTLVATRPVPGPPTAFSFPAFTRSTLSNGVTVVACHLPGKPLARAQLVLGAGAALEDPAKGGVAALAAGALTEGSERLGPAEFADAVERLGAEVDARAAWDALLVGATAPMAKMADALGLLAEVVRTPGFPPPEIDRLREERLNRIKQMRAHSGMRALLGFPKVTFAEGSPYARAREGEPETVAALTREDVAAFFGGHATPGAATLIVAGDLDGFDAEAVAGSLLGDWSAPEPDRAPAPAVDATGGPAVTLIDRPGSVQSDIVYGHSSLTMSDADRPLLNLVEEVFAGLFNSRMNMIIREEKGYTYGVRGSLESNRNYGVLYQWTPVQAPNTGDSLAILAEGFATIQADGLTQEELETARDYLIGVFPLRNETAQQIASLLTNIVVFDLPDDHYDAENAMLAGVTLEEVNAVAKRSLRPADARAVIVGDASQVADQVRAAGLGEVAVVADDE
ncbi:MAG TPA: pitrilysin family protein [Actinomycetota bacterium]